MTIQQNVLGAAPVIAAGPGAGIQRSVVALTAAALAAVALFLADAVAPRQAILFLLGGALGVALYHAAFGFTGGWRRFVVGRRSVAIRAQLVMIGLAAIAFLPLLAMGDGLAGAVAPIGVSVLVGAGLFGFGMQLGGGCGSGTLFTVGGGHVRMLVVLAFFVAGALLGTAHLPWWLERPGLPPVALGSALGWPVALAVQLAALGGLAWLVASLERRRHGTVEPLHLGRPSVRTLLRGPWPVLWGAVALAALNVATLLVAGHPWSITFAFGLWGAKIAAALGVDVGSWEFWNWPAPAAALDASVLADVTSVMDFGLILGAALAAGLAGKFAPAAKIPGRSLLAAAVGGILMGYGARLAFGCNVGALFSGIASGSLHGWLWLAAAFAGSYIGVRVRPWFGLDGGRAK